MWNKNFRFLLFCVSSVKGSYGNSAVVLLQYYLLCMLEASNDVVYYCSLCEEFCFKTPVLLLNHKKDSKK